MAADRRWPLILSGRYDSFDCSKYSLLDITSSAESSPKSIISLGFLPSGLVSEPAVLLRFPIETSGTSSSSLSNLSGWVCCSPSSSSLSGWENDWFSFSLSEPSLKIKLLNKTNS